MVVLPSNKKHIIITSSSKQHELFNGLAVNAQVDFVFAFLHSFDRTRFNLVDVPAEFDVTCSSLKEDFVDHQIVASKVECIELLRLKPIVSSSP